MFTILWRAPDGAEEIYVAPCVSKIPADPRLAEPADNAMLDLLAHLDCGGREHVAFQRLDGNGMVRSVIDVGEVFVMNAQGKTVATYRF